MNRNVLHFCLILIVLTITSCDKDQDEPMRDQILGTWVSIDNRPDTLTFTDHVNLWKPDIYGDHWNYKLIKDSIKIGYQGKSYIYVFPTMHKFYLNGNNLTIDFSNKLCYGFDKAVCNYIRKTN